MKNTGPANSTDPSNHLQLCWWNGGGAIRKRLSVNPGLGELMKSNPDFFVYGEAELSNTRGLFLPGYRFIFHRSYLRDNEKYRRGIVIFYKTKYHHLISKAYSSNIFDIVWIRLVTKRNPLYFCFFMLLDHIAQRR